MMRRSHEVGAVFGRLVVLGPTKRTTASRAYFGYACRCECGAEVFATAVQLSKGTSRQCRACADRNRKRGDRTKALEYRCWYAMNRRCHYTGERQYPEYGGRGVQVFPSWRCDNEKGFENFLAAIGPRPSLKYSIDRYPDNTGNYEPGNVRWATAKQQAHNRRNNVLMTVDGVTLPAAEWSKRTGLSQQTIWYRRQSGMTDTEAVKAPVGMSHRPREKDSRRTIIKHFAASTK